MKTQYQTAPITQRDITNYYRRVAPHLLGELRNRYVLPQNGVLEADRSLPTAGFTYRMLDGTASVDTLLTINDEATLNRLLELGMTTFSVLNANAHAPECPDRLLIHVDENRQGLRRLRSVAGNLYGVLVNAGLDPQIIANGVQGFRIECSIVRTSTFAQLNRFQRDVIKLVDKTSPRAELTNTYGGDGVLVTSAEDSMPDFSPAVYSVVNNGNVVAPITWREFVRRAPHPDAYDVRNIFRRLGQKDDARHQFNQLAQTLAPAQENVNELLAQAELQP